jgi:hypothetical protein
MNYFLYGAAAALTIAFCLIGVVSGRRPFTRSIPLMLLMAFALVVVGTCAYGHIGGARGIFSAMAAMSVGWFVGCPIGWLSLRLPGTLYGFRPPSAQDCVFAVTGDIEQVRVLDYAARQVLPGAVQSTIKDGLRYICVLALEDVSKAVASCVEYCNSNRWLKWLGWLLTLPAALLGYASIKATNADLNKRQYVRGADGSYILIFLDTYAEHRARSFMSQLNLLSVTEHFPPDCRHQPKPEHQEGTSESLTFTLNDKQVELKYS